MGWTLSLGSIAFGHVLDTVVLMHCALTGAFAAAAALFHMVLSEQQRYTACSEAGSRYVAPGHCRYNRDATSTVNSYTPELTAPAWR